MITSSATNDSNMSLIDENVCIRCKEERHGIGGGSDNSIDMYKCQVGCDGMVICKVIHSDTKEQFYEGKRQTDNSIVMYKCQGCIIQILSQYFRIFLGYRVLASKTYPICQLRVEK